MDKEKLKKKILEEMVESDEDKLIFELIDENPNLVKHYGGESAFEAVAHELYKKYAN